MMWDAFREHIEIGGGRLELNSRIARILHDGTRVTGVEVEHDGTTYLHPTDHVISTMPVRHLIQRLDPPAPKEVVEAASRLKYRDFLTVALIIDQAAVFPDNWIYVHDDRVQRRPHSELQELEPGHGSRPALYVSRARVFLFRWRRPVVDDRRRARRARDARARHQSGWRRPVSSATAPSCARRKRIPVYDEGYEAALQASRQFLERFSNLQLVGRNGMHKYNNQDHSMLTAMLAVRNLFGERHCLWDVNADEEYHEEDTIKPERATRPSGGRLSGQTQPAVPRLL